LADIDSDPNQRHFVDKELAFADVFREDLTTGVFSSQMRALRTNEEQFIQEVHLDRFEAAFDPLAEHWQNLCHFYFPLNVGSDPFGKGNHWVLGYVHRHGQTDPETDIWILNCKPTMPKEDFDREFYAKNIRAFLIYFDQKFGVPRHQMNYRSDLTDHTRNLPKQADQKSCGLYPYFLIKTLMEHEHSGLKVGEIRFEGFTEQDLWNIRRELAHKLDVEHNITIDLLPRYQVKK